jgi:hypothetical protein
MWQVCTEQIKSFGEGITNTAYWQVVLALTVAFTTYYFADRSRRKAELARAKSDASRYGYLLQQAWSNRLQGELEANYYERMIAIAPGKEDKIFFRDMARKKAHGTSSLSSEVGNIYGELIAQYGLIEQLSKKKDFESIRSDIDKFVNEHRTMFIKPMDEEINKENKAKLYLENGKVSISTLIESESEQKTKL